MLSDRDYGKVPRWVWMGFAVAAILIFGLILGALFIPRGNRPPPEPTPQTSADLLD